MRKIFLVTIVLSILLISLIFGCVTNKIQKSQKSRIPFKINDIYCDSYTVDIYITPYVKIDHLNWSDKLTGKNGTISTSNLKLYKENHIIKAIELGFGEHPIKICYKDYCEERTCRAVSTVYHMGPWYVWNTSIRGDVIEEKATPKYKENLIENGDFSNGLNDWTIENEIMSCEERQNAIIVNDTFHINAVKFERNYSVNIIGAIYIKQNLYKNVSNYKNLTLSLSVKIISHSLEGGGPKDSHVYGTFPVHVYIYYVSNNGARRVWSWGFTTEKSQHPNCNIIEFDKWYHFTSENLMNLNPKPARINRIVIGGEGYDLTSMVDDVELMAK